MSGAGRGRGRGHRRKQVQGSCYKVRMSPSSRSASSRSSAGVSTTRLPFSVGDAPAPLAPLVRSGGRWSLFMGVTRRGVTSADSSSLSWRTRSGATAVSRGGDSDGRRRARAEVGAEPAAASLTRLAWKVGAVFCAGARGAVCAEDGRALVVVGAAAVCGLSMGCATSAGLCPAAGASDAVKCCCTSPAVSFTFRPERRVVSRGER